MSEEGNIVINILFLRSEKAYLPEIDAYLAYFNSTKDFRAFEAARTIDRRRCEEYDVLWEFKGFGGKKPKNPLLVHEYASLSTAPLAKIKDWVKRTLNPKPGLRVFLNDFVKSNLRFDDDTPFCFRDMGIGEEFFRVHNTKKEFDFVYAGTISKARKIDQLLQAFTQKPNGTLCLIGTPEDEIYAQYKRNKDILFTGRVAYSEVPGIASKADYGINFVPDKLPFSMQTSTKLLEYLAMGLKIVTTDYRWVGRFEAEHGCSFYKLKNHPLLFDISEIRKHPFVSQIRMEDFLWHNVIARSNIENTIKLLVT